MIAREAGATPQAPIVEPRLPPPTVPAPPSAPPAPRVPFDWENLVGVKLFSAIAGIALVLAAVFFLRYSIDHGWLAPPVRVAIGVIVAIALLVVCELKAARKYAVTANALDAAAIAILFATFFAAHALWDLIPAARHVRAAGARHGRSPCCCRSGATRVFIAVLGLLGGFATPALLSTGENRPIPLFAYLLLLNVGLAWVAFAKAMAAAHHPHARPHGDLSVGLGGQVPRPPASCRWRWASSSSSRSMSFVALMLGAAARAQRRRASRRGSCSSGTGAAAALMPLLFAVYLAAVPRTARRCRRCCSGSCSCSTSALLAVAVAPPRGAGCTRSARSPTLLVFAIWLAQRTRAARWTMAIALRRGVRGASIVAGADDRRAVDDGRSRASAAQRDLRRAAAPVRLPGARAHRAGGGVAVAAVRHAVRRCSRCIAWRALAIARLGALLHRRVLRRRRRSLVVGDASCSTERLGTAARCSTRVRRLLSRRAARRAADRPTARAARGAPAPC